MSVPGLLLTDPGPCSFPCLGSLKVKGKGFPRSGRVPGSVAPGFGVWGRGALVGWPQEEAALYCG